MKVIKKETAFTLIELLVVISIIALLLAVIMPALNIAKKQASAAVCLSNVRQLVVAWRMYAGDNDAKLCEPNTDFVDTTTGAALCWVGPPRVPNWPSGTIIDGGNAAGCTAEQEIDGIEYGTLYPYYEDYEVTHCPADKRSRKAPAFGGLGGVGGYRTYSIPILLGSTVVGGAWAPANKLCVRLSDVSNPSSKYCFVEENDSRNYNWNSWAMNLTPPDYGFVDPFGIFHGDKGIMAYVDGHAEKQVWKDQDTKEHSQGIFDGTITDFTQWNDPGNVDLQWLGMHNPRK